MENATLPRNVNHSALRFELQAFDQCYPVSAELELAAAPLAEHGTRNVLNNVNSPEPSSCKRSWHWDRSSVCGISPAGTSQEAANAAHYDPSVSFNLIPSGSTNDGDSGGYESLSKEKSASENNTSNESELLTLKLFGNGYSHEEEVRDSSPYSKRCKVLFPQGQHPKCQVDGCLADLINAKDYHKRHKVCEQHAKADKVFVAKSIQRFCQQCSRFHPLEEFDENKRSCRRRLAGHNKRRRKANPITASTLQTEDPITNLLRLLTSLQGCSDFSELDRILSGTSELLRLLAGANSSASSLNDKPIQTEDFGAGLHGLNKELLLKFAGSREASFKQPEMKLPHVSSISTVANIYDKNEQFSQYSLPGSSSTLSPNSMDPLLPPNEALLGNNMGPTSSKQTRDWLQSRAGNQHWSDGNISRVHGNENSVEKLPAWHERLVVLDSDEYQCRRDLSSCYRSFDLPTFPPELANANCDLPSSDYQSHINPDSVEWTDRIVFKLFDKKTGELPSSLQKQILEWLAHSPSNMESYIRPGCVILTIFLSMSSSAWERLCTDIKYTLVRLINISDSEFWQRGRILVQIGKKIGFIFEGNVYVHSLFNSLRIPELICVKPAAVVMDESTELRVKSRNLKASCARIICNYRGSSTVKDISFEVQEKENDDGCKLDRDDANEEESFSFQVGPFHGPGRCLIEVEQNGIGGAFPIIIADSAICEEICMLQSKFKNTTRSRGSFEGTESRNMTGMIYFLHEFGWLLERERQMCYVAANVHFSGDFSLSRFGWLLTFAVEHNCCSVTLKLLDFLFEIGVQSKETIFAKAMKALSEAYLLHRAVKINSSRMVKLLLEYSPSYLVSQTSSHIFTLDSPGPGGLTPLHIAACMKSAVEILDALTEGPIHVWFSTWTSSRDKSGRTPLSYALASGNHSYIRFVQNKHSRLNAPNAESVNIMMPAYPTTYVHKSNIPSSTVATETKGIGGERTRSNDRFSVPDKLAINGFPCKSCCALTKPSTLGTSHRIGGIRISMYRPLVLSLVSVAAVCVCVCILLKGPPVVVDAPSPFIWDAVGFGSY